MITLHRAGSWLMVTLPLFAAGCGDPTGVHRIDELPRSLSTQERALIDASNVFAWDLLGRVQAADTSANIFLSPLSASMALGMAMNGAGGQTWTQMRDVLGFAGLEEAEVNDAYQSLIALLLDLDPSVTFGLGNSIWADDGVPFHDAFYERATEHFDAEVRELPFSDPTTLDAINGWVSEATEGRIPKLLDRIPPEMIMYLINAVYFQGDWTTPFDPDRTSDGSFELATGEMVKVPIMSLETELRSFRTADAIGVELPYGGGAFTAVGVLPQWESTVDELVGSLDAATWTAWMAHLEAGEPAEVTVRLPRLEIEYGRRLNDDLIDLGMSDAFDEVAADLTRLTPLDLPAGQGPPWVFVSDVRQKTFLKVDEKGTEAAAATSVGIGVDSAPVCCSFDRPFLFVIRERLSGTILFAGVIGDPRG